MAILCLIWILSRLACCRRVTPDREERLTCIPRSYTLASTPEHGSETDRLMIDHFLHTLAEIASAVASRNLKSEQQERD